MDVLCGCGAVFAVLRWFGGLAPRLYSAWRAIGVKETQRQGLGPSPPCCPVFGNSGLRKSYGCRFMVRGGLFGWGGGDALG